MTVELRNLDGLLDLLAMAVVGRFEKQSQSENTIPDLAVHELKKGPDVHENA